MSIKMPTANWSDLDQLAVFVCIFNENANFDKNILILSAKFVNNQTGQTC